MQATRGGLEGEEQAAGVTTAAVFLRGTQASATGTTAVEELRGARHIMSGVSSRGGGEGNWARAAKGRKRGQGGLDLQPSRE